MTLNEHRRNKSSNLLNSEFINLNFNEQQNHRTKLNGYVVTLSSQCITSLQRGNRNNFSLRDVEIVSRKLFSLARRMKIRVRKIVRWEKCNCCRLASIVSLPRSAQILRTRDALTFNYLPLAIYKENINYCAMIVTFVD